MAETKPYVPPIPPSGAQLLATRTVRVKATGDEAVINAADFDAALHEEPGAKAPAGGASTAALEALTVAQLTALAGERKVELGDATKKADLIAALVAAGITAP